MTGQVNMQYYKSSEQENVNKDLIWNLLPQRKSHRWRWDFQYAFVSDGLCCIYQEMIIVISISFFDTDL
jgi:hypothetical protein